jgi:hypothetical protein
MCAPAVPIWAATRVIAAPAAAPPVSVSLDFELSYDDIYRENETRSQEGFAKP